MVIRTPRHGFSVSRRLSERARANRAETTATQEPVIEGIAGMMESLKGLVERLSESAKSAPQESGAADAEAAASDRFSRTVNFAGGKARMVFGYTLRVGSDGISAEPFGDVPPAEAAHQGSSPGASAAAPQPAALQPIVDVFEDGPAVVVVAELPGADAETIVCRVQDTELVIEASGLRRYRKTLTLPAKVDPDGITQTYRNGILEVRMARADAP